MQIWDIDDRLCHIQVVRRYTSCNLVLIYASFDKNTGFSYLRGF
jgi:hypothetical protein